VTGAAVAGSVGEALESAREALAAAGVETPALDAELLLAEATGFDRGRLVADSAAGVEPAAGRRFGEMVRRRLRREPLAYILGRKGFRHLELSVDARVLIPRPETELLVEAAGELGPATVLDVGTGSGAVALAIADELAGVEVTATDASAAALEVARANAGRLGLGGRVTFEEGSLPRDATTFDLVVANLPYVSEAEWEGLQPEITLYEPREALVAGPTGLEGIEGLLGAIAVGELSAAAIALEVGEGQAGTVSEIVRRAGYGEVEVRKDLAGIERVVIGR
jgi:release factor glutamine methyltransferase